MCPRSTRANRTGTRPRALAGARGISALAKTRLAILILCLGVVALPSTSSAATGVSDRSNSIAMHVSASAGLFRDWVIASGDNHGLPFVIVDKKSAEVLVFYPDGRLRGAAPALLGLAHGDDSVPGIGQRKLSSITPEERTTPAGRFVASLGNDLGTKNVLWVDYDDAISLHRVITTNPKEQRLHRLATASILDNRISFGCINVPVKFYDTIVEPSFTGTNGIVYILPETRSIQATFPAYAVDEKMRSSN
jgi:hypothetical protein